LQRLFTTFAAGWPGMGLLLQRLVTGLALLNHGIVLFQKAPALATLALQCSTTALAILLIIGLWTPVAAALVAAVEVWITLLDPSLSTASILLAALGASLAMIGPGAYSVDARLFGRKHIGM